MMNLHSKRVIAVAVFLGLTLLGCAALKKEKQAPLNRQEKSAIAAIDRKAANGTLTPMEADIEANAVRSDHNIKF